MESVDDKYTERGQRWYFGNDRACLISRLVFGQQSFRSLESVAWFFHGVRPTNVTIELGEVWFSRGAGVSRFGGLMAFLSAGLGVRGRGYAVPTPGAFLMTYFLSSILFFCIYTSVYTEWILRVGFWYRDFGGSWLRVLGNLANIFSVISIIHSCNFCWAQSGFWNYCCFQ